jgi:hypothetical protein
MTFTNVVFPEYCNPTRVSSISSFQKRLLNQSNTFCTRASILFELNLNLKEKKIKSEKYQAKFTHITYNWL